MFKATAVPTQKSKVIMAMGFKNWSNSIGSIALVKGLNTTRESNNPKKI
jgi:hypothetical protein